jgi:hypothetical protein
MYRVLILIGFTFISFKTFSQEIAILNKKNNSILYQWLGNPLKVVIEGYNCNEIIVKSSGGKFEGSGCDYTFSCDHKLKEVYFYYGIIQNKKVKWIDTIMYRIRSHPTPTVYFVGVSPMYKDTFSLNELKLCYFPTTELAVKDYFILFSSLPFYPILDKLKDSFDYYLFIDDTFPLIYTTFEIGYCSYPSENIIATEYTLNVLRDDTLFYQEKYNYPDIISLETKKYFLSKCKSGDIIIFSDIVLTLFGEEKRKVKNMRFFVR